jgi:sortase A
MKRSLTKVTSLVLGGSGILLILAVLFPILSYEVKSRSDFRQYLSPVPEQEFTDFTKASSWFPTAKEQQDSLASTVVKYYNISIPKLGIQDAVVSLGGEDLSDSLIQYPGTALPGKIGNAVVFGHSVLPTFYDPKLYLTIFSTLPTLKKQDTIQVDYDGISYQYRVAELFEVSPDDLDVLSQETGESYLSLVTCVPPGDPRSPRRLIVRAKLVPPDDKTLSYTP